MKRLKLIYALIFLALMLGSTLFLFRPGFWLYQDAFYWPKNADEIIYVNSSMWRTYLVYNFSYGFDMGIFTFARFIPQLLSFTFSALLRNTTISQIVFIYSGFILYFISFYLFSSIFFKSLETRILLSFLFTFNPLFFNILNQSYIQTFAGTPFLIYAIYQIFQPKNTKRYKYILLSILAVYLSTAYLRFIQIAFILFVYYFVYFLLFKRIKFSLSRALETLFFLILAFAPSIFVLSNTFLQRETLGSTNYAKAFKGYVPDTPVYGGINIWQAINVKVYDGLFYTIAGILSFSFLIFVFLKYQTKLTRFQVVNLCLIVLSIFTFALPIFLGEEGYFRLLRFLPFIQNTPYYALYIIIIPFILLIGSLTTRRILLLRIFTAIFVFVSCLPFFNFPNNPVLHKVRLEDIPSDYKKYLVNVSIEDFVEPSYYVPDDCWYGKWLQGKPFICFHNILKYKTIQENNPRILVGKQQEISLSLKSISDINLDNLRVTHGLKNIFVAKDLVDNPAYPDFINRRDASNAFFALDKFAKNSNLIRVEEPNFDLFYYKDKDKYDFFIYLARQLVYKQVSDLFDNSLDIYQAPAVVSKNLQVDLDQKAEISYKNSSINATKHYLKISNWDRQKPLSLQMNLLFGKAWTVRWIDRETYDARPCTSQIEYHEITKNYRCRYARSLLDFGDILYLNRPLLNPANHMEGNFLGNNWLIYPEDIPEEYRQDQDLYLVIISDKQIYLTYSILTTFSVIIFLLVLSFVQELDLFKKVTQTHA